MKTPNWVLEKTVRAIHLRQIAEHGGLDGLRDENSLLSALAKPHNLLAYDNDADLASLAAAYLFGLARNHPFADGNKRVAAVVAELFLELNGQTLEVPDEDWYLVVMEVAKGELSEEALAIWFRTQLG